MVSNRFCHFTCQDSLIDLTRTSASTFDLYMPRIHLRFYEHMRTATISEITSITAVFWRRQQWLFSTDISHLNTFSNPTHA